MAKINIERIEPGLYRAWVDGHAETVQLGLTESFAVGEVVKNSSRQLDIKVESVSKGSYDTAQKS